MMQDYELSRLEVRYHSKCANVAKGPVPAALLLSVFTVRVDVDNFLCGNHSSLVVIVLVAMRQLFLSN